MGRVLGVACSLMPDLILELRHRIPKLAEFKNRNVNFNRKFLNPNRQMKQWRHH